LGRRRKMKIKEIFNKILWDPREKERKNDYEIVFIHRGAYQDRKTIPVTMIKEVKSSMFIYVNEIGEETYIPFHRILEIRNRKTGEILWSKRTRESNEPIYED